MPHAARISGLLLLLGGCMPLFHSAPAAAQSADSGQIEEIVVTAQKRSEKLLDVPSSIVALPQTALEQQHAVDLEDYVALVPGLTLNARAGGIQQISIRGVTTGSGGNPTVSTYIDDAPVGASTSQAAGGSLTADIDPNDIERVEVLRGPQGTLYGADNLGGLVRFVTVQPNVDRMEGRTWLDTETVENGDFGYAVRSRINLPLAEGKVALLVSGFGRKDPGYVDNAALGLSGVNETRAEGGRVALLWNVAEDLSIRLSAIGHEKKFNGVAEEDVDPQTLRPLYGDLQQRRAPGTGGDEDRLRIYTATIDWNAGWAAVSSTTSYNTLAHTDNHDYTGFLQAPLEPVFGNLSYAVADDISQRKLSEELRVTSQHGRYFDWRVGGFYTRELGSIGEGIPTLNPLTGEPVSIPLDILTALTTSEFKEYAAFGEATVHLTPSFDFTAGLRYAHNEQDISQVFSGLLTGDVNTQVNSNDSATTFAVTPRLKLTDNTTLYARVASGYRPGGPNYPTSPPTPATFGPDRDVNYELGAKAVLPDSRVSFDLAFFYVKWTDIQLNVSTPSGLQYTANAGAASSRGAELAVNYSPVSALRLSGALAYADARLDRDIPSGSVGTRGDPLPYSPRFKGNLNAEYGFGHFREWEPFIGANYLFNGSERIDFQQDTSYSRIRLPAYQMFGLQLGARNDTWTVEFFAKNFADKRAFNSAAALSGDPQGPYALGVIQPRTLGLSVIAKY